MQRVAKNQQRFLTTHYTQRVAHEASSSHLVADLKTMSKDNNSTTPSHLLVNVGDAGKVGEGVHSHYVYPVTSQLFSVDTITRDRRYSDFCWLSDALAKECKGYVIPPLPAKVVSVLQGPEFLERRRRALQVFLRSIQRHNALKDANAFQKFCIANNVELTSVKTKLKNETPITSSISSWWGKKKQQWNENEALRALAGKEMLEGGDEDENFTDATTYVSTLVTDLKNLEARAGSVYGAGYTLATSLYELASSVSVLAESEENVKTTKRLSSIEPILKERARQAECEVYPFMEEIGYVLQCVLAMQRALNAREDERFAYQAACANVKKISNVAVSTSEITRANRLMSDCKESFDTVHGRVMVEFQRFKKEKSLTLRRIFTQFAELQVEYNADLVKVLANSIPLEEAESEEDEDTSSFHQKANHQSMIDIRAPPAPVTKKEESSEQATFMNDQTTTTTTPGSLSQSYTDIAL